MTTGRRARLPALAPACLAATLLALAAPAVLAQAAKPARFYAGADRGVDAQLARDIDRLVARPAGIELRSRQSAGGIDTLLKLRQEPLAASFALLSSDTPAALAELGGDNPDARELLAGVRVIAPVHDDEIYFVTRSDSPLHAVHEIKGLRISAGVARSGDSATVSTVYRLLFGEPPAEDRLSFFEREDALVRLVTDQSVDVVAFVAPQPDRLLADMKAEARRFVKLLRFDPAHPASAAVLARYRVAPLRTASYPGLLTEDLPALSLRTYLVEHGNRSADSDALTGRLAASWCQNLTRLKTEAHPALRNAGLAEPGLPAGWQVSRAAEREFARCSGAPLPTPRCSRGERILGLCDT